MQRRESALWHELANHGKTSKPFVITLRDRLPPGNEFGEAIKLPHAERRLNVGHTVVEAEHHLLVVPRAFGNGGHISGIARNAMVAQQAHAMGDLSRTRGRRTAFSCCHNLDGMEGKNGNVSELARTDGPILIVSANGMARVFKDAEAVSIRQPADRGKICGSAGEVHWNDNLRQGAVALSRFELGG